MSYTMWGGGSGSSSDNGNSFGGVGNGGQLMDRRIDHIYKAINTLSLRITDLESIRDASDAKVEPVDFGDLEWRFKQMHQDMKFMWNRLADLEAARDEKVEPDAGEPTNRYLVECLKENARLIEENDVLRYQYETMKNETMRCKEQIEQLQKALADKQKVLEDVMDQRDRYLKQIYAEHRELEDVKKSNEYLRGTLKNYEDRVAELERENKSLKESIGNQKTIYHIPSNMNLDRVAKITELEKHIDDLTKKLAGEKAAAFNLEKSSGQWQQKYHGLQAVTEKLENDKEFWVERSEKLQLENGDLKWRFDNPDMVEKQTARTCLALVTKIKNEPLTTMSPSREWMVAICEDIERLIKKEFDLK